MKSFVHLVSSFYEYCEFVIWNDSYKIVLYKDYHNYDNTLYIHHLRDNI